MNPVSLWAYVRPEDVEKLRSLVAAEAAAQATLDRIAAKLSEVELEASHLAARSHASPSEAAARALGEAGPVAPPPAPPRDRAELELAARGLAVRRQDAQREVEKAHGALRVALIEAAERAAQAAAHEYAAAADRLTEAWTVIGSAQRFALGVAGSSVPRSVVSPDWNQLHIPGSTALEALKRQTRNHIIPPSMWSARDDGYAAAKLAYDRFTADVKQAIGVYPFNS